MRIFIALILFVVYLGASSACMRSIPLRFPARSSGRIYRVPSRTSVTSGNSGTSSITSTRSASAPAPSPKKTATVVKTVAKGTALMGAGTAMQVGGNGISHLIYRDSDPQVIQPDDTLLQALPTIVNQTTSTTKGIVNRLLDHIMSANLSPFVHTSTTTSAPPVDTSTTPSQGKQEKVELKYRTEDTYFVFRTAGYIGAICIFCFLIAIVLLGCVYFISRREPARRKGQEKISRLVTACSDSDLDSNV